MKTYIFVAAILLQLGSTLAQEVSCGFEVSEDYYENMRQSFPEFEHYKELYVAHSSEFGSRSFASKKNSIPIRLHIVRQTTGVTSLDTSLITKGLKFMNAKFAGAGLEFYVCGVYNYINNSTYYDLDNTEYELLNNTYGASNVINIYMVNSISHAGSAAIGVAPTPGGSLWVMLRNNADTTVYAHEMGHFFGLLHTQGFSSTGKTDEFVDGSNCHEAGDFFCDTPADPTLSPAITTGANVNSSCIYIGGLKDGHDQVYVPDATNIMSYAPHRCLSHFSAEQLAYMNWVYLNRRSNLACSSVQVDFNSASLVSCDSPYVFNFINQSVGLTSLRWDINDDDVIDYTISNPNHTYPSAGVKWVSLSGVNAGKTYMRYKPIEFIVPTKLPSLNNFNSSLLLPSGWKFINYDNGRSWELAVVIGSNGQSSNALRFRNFNYVGYEEKDEFISNSFDLRGFRNARLSFDIAYAPSAVSDSLFVYLSTDCGASYPIQLLKLSGSALQSHTRQYQEFIPTEADWKSVLISLNAYVNNFIRIKMVNYNKGGNNIYIDNIRIEGGDSALNEVGFAKTYFSVTENNANIQQSCRKYKIIDVPVFISSAPSSPVNVNILASGTASAIYDFELLTTALVFPAGSSDFQYVSLKIFDDQASELVEQLQLTMSVSGSSSYQCSSRNRTSTIEITDNDPMLAEDKIFSKVLLDERFERMTAHTLPGWTTALYISSAANGAWFYDPLLATRNNTLDSTDYMINFTGGGLHAARNAFLVTPVIPVVDYDSLLIEFDQWYKVRLPYSGNIVVEAWNGSTWVNQYTYNAFLGNLGNSYKPNHVKVSAVGFTNIDFKLRIGLVNDAASYWYLVDNVKVIGFKRKAKVAQVIGSSSAVTIGPHELVHAYDDSTGQIISTIQNLTNWDYGCTAIGIDRAGDSIVAYTTADSNYFASQKTIFIQPTTNNPTGVYDISLYFSANEMNSWLTRTNNMIVDASIVKTGGPISNISPANPTANGATNFTALYMNVQPYQTSSYKLAGQFTQGFSGFAMAKNYSNPLPVQLSAPLRAEYINGYGNSIQWATLSENNCDFFELQRSKDADNFERIAILEGAGNANSTHHYYFVDSKYSLGLNYYRFKQVDFNREYYYSNVDVINNEAASEMVVQVYPNPSSDFLQLIHNKNRNLRYEIIDMQGRVVQQDDDIAGRINIGLLESGFYLLRLVDKDSNDIQLVKITKL